MSDSFLSQEEVDALLEGVTGESQRSEVVEVDLGQVRSHAGFKRGLDQRDIHLVEGRLPAMRSRPFGE